MAHLSPEGGVYQAGTLSGNPVTMAAGITTLKKLKAQPEVYERLNERAQALVRGLRHEAHRNSIPLQADARGSMVGFFFNDNPVHSFQDAAKYDLKRFSEFHHKMLHMGAYFACSQFEAGFISTQTDGDMIEQTVAFAAKIFEDMGDQL